MLLLALGLAGLFLEELLVGYSGLVDDVPEFGDEVSPPGEFGPNLYVFFNNGLEVFFDLVYLVFGLLLLFS